MNVYQISHRTLGGLNWIRAYSQLSVRIYKARAPTSTSSRKRNPRFLQRIVSDHENTNDEPKRSILLDLVQEVKHRNSYVKNSISTDVLLRSFLETKAINAVVKEQRLLLEGDPELADIERVRAEICQSYVDQIPVLSMTDLEDIVNRVVTSLPSDAKENVLIGLAMTRLRWIKLRQMASPGDVLKVLKEKLKRQRIERPN